MLSMSESLKQVVTLGNSIIGVSVLAMPYCFKQCGILLGIVILMASALVTRFNCHLLLKAALICRRKTYEHLAFHSFGFHGKLAVETSIIGFLLGILISFYVVIGDIAPAIISELFNVENKPSLRTIILTAVALGVALPFGLLKNISSLGNISALSFCFYACFIFKIFADAFPVLINEKWWQKISFWQPEGILRCLPIFSLALSCQTQIFEIYDSLPDPSLGKMNKIIKLAVNLCVFVYVAVGFLGYVAFCNDDFSGNVLVNMPTTFLSKIIKLGFVLSVALSFPLVIFPCRTSLCSLLSKKSYTGLDMSNNYVSEFRFRAVTFMIVLITLIMGILCPNIELVLGLVGSTIGTVICIVFPAFMFVRVTNRNILERNGAQFVFCCGLILLIACTYATIHKSDQDTEISVPNLNQNPVVEFSEGTLGPAKLNMKLIEKVAKPSDTYELPKIEKPVTLKFEDKDVKVIESINENQRRLEPPIPQEPDSLVERKQFQEVKDPEKVKPEQEKIEKHDDSKAPDKATLKGDVKPEEKIRDVASQQEELLKKIEHQQKEQMKLIEEQKHLLEELKAHKESHHKDGSENLGGKDESKKLKVDPQKLPLPKKEIQKALLETKEKEPPPHLQEKEGTRENEASARISNRTVLHASAESKHEIPVEKEIMSSPSQQSIKEQSKRQGNIDLEPTVQTLQKKELKDDFRQDKTIHQNVAEKVVVQKRDAEVSPVKERKIPLKETYDANDGNNQNMKSSKYNVSSNKQQFSSHLKDGQKEEKLDIPSDVKVVDTIQNVFEKGSQDIQSHILKNDRQQKVLGNIILKPNSVSIDQVPSVIPKDVPIKNKDAGVWRKDEQK